MEDELRTARAKIVTLEANIEQFKWNADLFKDSDKRARYYTKGQL